MARPYKCPNCKSTNTTWKGYRKTLEGPKESEFVKTAKKDLQQK